MKGTGGLIIVVVGLLVLWLAVTGKLTDWLASASKLGQPWPGEKGSGTDKPTSATPGSTSPPPVLTSALADYIPKLSTLPPPIYANN